MIDIATLHRAGQVPAALPQGLEGSLRAEIVIAAPAALVRAALLDVTAWPRLMPWFRNVRCIYNDSGYQEFAFDVVIGARCIAVRSVRRCEPDRIGYFFPDPASFLKHHCGDWFIDPLTPEATRLTAVQSWVLSSKAATLFPARDGITPGQHVSALLHDHTHTMLAAFGAAT